MSCLGNAPANARLQRRSPRARGHGRPAPRASHRSPMELPRVACHDRWPRSCADSAVHGHPCALGASRTAATVILQEARFGLVGANATSRRRDGSPRSGFCFEQRKRGAFGPPLRKDNVQLSMRTSLPKFSARVVILQQLRIETILPRRSRHSHCDRMCVFTTPGQYRCRLRASEELAQRPQIFYASRPSRR